MDSNRSMPIDLKTTSTSVIARARIFIFYALLIAGSLVNTPVSAETDTLTLDVPLVRDEISSHLPSMLIAALAMLFALRQHRTMRHCLEELQELKETNTKLTAQTDTPCQLIVEHTNVGLWHISDNGKTHFMNPAMRALLQINHENELSDNTRLRFLLPEAGDANRDKQAISYKATITDKRGDTHTVLVAERRLFDGHGENQSVLRSITEISDIAESTNTKAFRNIAV